MMLFCSGSTLVITRRLMGGCLQGSLFYNDSNPGCDGVEVWIHAKREPVLMCQGESMMVPGHRSGDPAAPKLPRQC